MHDVIQRMTASIFHRGPDDCGVWIDENAGVALGHRRLSIVDLSPAGHQPMLSASGRYTLVFNGEIYNHWQLRAELDAASAGNSWRGSSDTETLLAAIDHWGLEKSLCKSVGMFALALWDRCERRLYLARDRFGEKPLYYGWCSGVFIFASELKAIKSSGLVDLRINRDVITLLLRHNYIPAPYSIYHDIAKLTPGCILEVNLSKDVCQLDGATLRVTSYWSMQEVVQTGSTKPFKGTEAEAVQSLEQVLATAISQQMVADVPVGAFLSGGVDSSTVVALMCASSSRRVKTFSIGFHESDFNEAEHAAAVARHFGTEHTEFYVTSAQALEIIPRLPMLYDEPFSDSSQIPTFLLAELTRRHVTVSLSGDGGDEIFGGYRRYFLTQSWWHRLERLPVRLKQTLAKWLLAIPPSFWDGLGNAAFAVAGAQNSLQSPASKIAKLAGMLTSANGAALYQHFVSHCSQPDAIVRDSVEPPTSISVPELQLDNIIEQMMYLDSISYLPDDILCKVDRASMGVSLESRVPFLDHRVAEFAWSLPLSLKIRGGVSKWVLRQVLYKHVPRTMIDRPKMGFAIPLHSWLRGPLRNWSESLLDEKRLEREGYFNTALVRLKWQEHLSGKRDWAFHLWDILMFQAWLEVNQ